MGVGDELLPGRVHVGEVIEITMDDAAMGDEAGVIAVGEGASEGQAREGVLGFGVRLSALGAEDLSSRDNRPLVGVLTNTR
jgi:hypothetical protein